jgi:short-subunit dehydrogenase/acyl carrier protein
MKSLRWVPAPLASMAAPRVGRWWIVGDGDGLAGSLAAALEAAGDAVVCQRCDEPTVEATRAKLAAAFEGRPPTGIVHLRATDPAGDGDHVEAGLARGCDSVLQLVNAISAMGWRDAPRLHLVTRGAQAVDPGLSTGPARDVDFMQSALLGLARVIATEHPELRPLRIDLDPIRPDDGSAALHAELLAGDDEDEVAWRAGKRSAARLVRTPAPTGGLERRRERAVSVRRDGSYLVTGGLGGLGLHAADWLSRKGAGAVVLVGRSGATTAEQRGALARIEARGTVVVVAAADAVDRASMARLLEAIPSDRPLRGVIHVAGVLDDGVLGDLTAERMRVTFAPKARGAVNLHALTRGMELDFFVLYGSVAGVLGMPAQGNYAAANACLDGLAHHRRALGLPATSIDWGLFGEVGLATAQANRGRRLEARGMRAMTPVEGMAALERVLERDLTQVLVLPIDMRRWSALMPAGSRMLAPLLEDAPAESPRAATTRVPEVARVTAGTPLEAMTELVRADVARVLSLGRLGAVPPGKPLRELGLDSLMAVELRNALGRRVGIPLPSTLTIDHPTPLAIARYMLSVAPAPPPVEAPTAHRVMAPLRFEVRPPVAPREDTIESIPMGERWFADSFRVIPAPGGYAQRAVDVSAAMRAVQALNEAGVGATLTHVMIRAAALALARNPELHQLVCGYRKLTPGQVDIGLSMAGKTTYAPVVVLAAADGVSLGDMVARVEEATVRGRAKETLDLATLRRVGWMTPVGFLRRLSVRVMQEMFWYRRKLVGTFQVTCVPTVDATVPLQFYSGSILSFGRPRDAVVPIDGRPSIRPMLTLTVCVDHVAMDGMRAATLVNAIAAIVDSEELVDEARQGVTRAVTARETCRAQGRVAALQPLASGT